MNHIFISHAAHDDVVANRITTALKQSGFTPWIDHHDLPAGEQWQQNIERAIQQANTALFVLSPYSASSNECNAELKRLARLNKRTIVARVSPDADLKVPEVVAYAPQIDLTQDWNAGLQRLIQAMREPAGAIERAAAVESEPNEEGSVTVKVDFSRLQAGQVGQLMKELVESGVKDIEIVDASVKKG